eukprot:5750233-Amphidinium_carterae.1
MSSTERPLTANVTARKCPNHHLKNNTGLQAPMAVSLNPGGATLAFRVEQHGSRCSNATTEKLIMSLSDEHYASLNCTPR